MKYSGLVLLIWSLWTSAAFAAMPQSADSDGMSCDTLIFDTFHSSPAEQRVLLEDPGLCWSAEFGHELLLAIRPEHFLRMQLDKRVRGGLGLLHPSQLSLREHACSIDRMQPAIGVVGGFEVMKVTPLQTLLKLSHEHPRLMIEPTQLSSFASNSKAQFQAPQTHFVVSKALSNGVTAALSKRATDAKVLAVVNQIDPSKWLTSLQTLTGFDRNTFNPDLHNAHDWILQQFNAVSLSTTSFRYNVAANYCQGNAAVNLGNPIGMKIGETLANEWLVIGAHYDSRNVNQCEVSGAQPGANDNGSGCAGVIELARVLSRIPTARSIVFMCFSGEEQGLLGSLSYVNSLINSKELGKVKLMINLDMIAHDPTGNQVARIETIPIYQATLYPLFAQAAADYAPQMNLIQSSNTQAYSDHWYFSSNGVPAIFTWENGAGIYPQYHTEQDIVAALSNPLPLVNSILRMDAAVIAQHAQLLSDFANGFE